MRLVWSLKSRVDLASIRDYILLRNPAAAEKVVGLIISSALRLEFFPQLGRAAEISEVRLLQVAGLPYLLPYRVWNDDIEILAVFDERQERPEEWL